jgi:hypothetical protein
MRPNSRGNSEQPSNDAPRHHFKTTGTDQATDAIIDIVPVNPRRDAAIAAMQPSLWATCTVYGLRSSGAPSVSREPMMYQRHPNMTMPNTA